MEEGERKSNSMTNLVISICNDDNRFIKGKKLYVRRFCKKLILYKYFFTLINTTTNIKNLTHNSDTLFASIKITIDVKNTQLLTMRDFNTDSTLMLKDFFL